MSSCPHCAAEAELVFHPVAGGPEGACALICPACAEQINGTPDPDRWRGLANAMWSEDPALQVIAARMLVRHSAQPWARDLADQLYLAEDVRVWAENVASSVVHRDCHGTILIQGDTVTLVKDLPVKGAGFTARRGTAVRGISPVADNPAQIEGPSKTRESSF